MKKKACTRCKMFVEGNTCPNCNNTQFSTNWQGRIYINNPEKSSIAKKLSVTQKGEYALKVK